MQRKAAGQFAQLGAIEIIAGNRAADMGKMHADLMGSAGLKPQAEQRTATAGAHDAVMRHSALAAFAHGTACARAKARNGRVDGPGFMLRNAFGDGQILADKAAGVQLSGQQMLGMRMARDAQKAAVPLSSLLTGW